MIRKLQQEHVRWANRNFPGDHPSWHPLLGIAEEVGELNHHYLKRVQNIRNGEDHVNGIKDALGDIVIFLADFCNREGIDFQSAIEKAWKEVSQRDWQKDPELGTQEAHGLAIGPKAGVYTTTNKTVGGEDPVREQILKQMDEFRDNSALGMSAALNVNQRNGMVGYPNGIKEDEDVDRKVQELQGSDPLRQEPEKETDTSGSLGGNDRHSIRYHLQGLYSTFIDLLFRREV